ncbi:MAG: S9 family peptidase [Burkholderiaceae bacterium]|nr:S9 family peptidase [Burkholderiaceae bacterium]
MASARPAPARRRAASASTPATHAAAPAEAPGDRPTAAEAITVEHLWQMERLGAPSLSPDGAQAVVALQRWSMEDNRGHSRLWLLSTLGGAPRALTHCGEKDGDPAWSPRGDRIAFLAQREQDGVKDEARQLYLIAPDGGEAQRATRQPGGIEAFRWLPDGRRIAFVAWVWPDERGSAAQARRHQDWQARRASGYVTSEALYRYWDHLLPQDRVPHLHLLDLDSGEVTDLFEGSPFELSRSEPDRQAFDISADGRRLVFAYDAAAVKRVDARRSLWELDLTAGRPVDSARPIVQDGDWDCHSPRCSPPAADGSQRVAFIASHQGRKHTQPQQLAVWERDSGRWQVESAAWDHDVEAPLLWEDDGQALLFAAEAQGARHLWRFDLPDQRAERVHPGGWVNAFDKAAGSLVVNVDAIDHPPRLLALLPGEPVRRMEHFNDALLAGLKLGRSELHRLQGAQGDAVQLRLIYPPDFDPARRWPLLHTLHGGPHSAFGDNWHWRWNHQVLAAAGYVVACVNYHGSSGFGHAFSDSITHHWGELELQDIEAASDWLLEQPWADPARLYASGGSYGGYLVAWMNGHIPAGRYAAYVCHAGCFDWTAMFADDAYHWYAKELGAWYWEDPARIAAQSPHARAGAMDTPTLVIHGALDYRVPDAQGLAYYNTLKARGVDARLLWFPDENHWVLEPANSRLWYEEVLAWLGRHRLPQGTAPQSPRRRQARR